MEKTDLELQQDLFGKMTHARMQIAKLARRMREIGSLTNLELKDLDLWLTAEALTRAELAELMGIGKVA